MKIKLLPFVAFAALLFSCSDDDDSNTVSNPEGLYRMTAFNISEEPSDLDGDGDASTNIMNETHCFDNSTVQINEDHTFTANSEGLEIQIDSEGNPSEFACYDDGAISGTWSLSGNEITFTFLSDGSGDTFTYDIDADSLSYFIPDGTAFGTVGGNPAYITSDIEIVYTKQ
ncbi:MAG TPA: lipocalin family protein [Flavobacterium sp.]|jgi:hypothetical protein